MSKLFAALAASTLLAFAAPGVAGADETYPGSVTTDASVEEVDEGVWDDFAGQEIDPDDVDWSDDEGAPVEAAAASRSAKAKTRRAAKRERTVATRKAAKSKRSKARRAKR